MHLSTHRPHIDSHHPLWLWLAVMTAFLLAVFWSKPIH